MSKKHLGISSRKWVAFFLGMLIAAVIEGCLMSAHAGVPVKFTVETSRADTQNIDCYHGETLNFEVSFRSYGKPLEIPTSYEPQIFWQTNGMAGFFWRTNNVTVVSNSIMKADFLPEMDPGNNTAFGFIGVPGQIYRAAFVLRFKNSPGVKVREMEWPYRDLDFAQIEVRNAPYYTKEEAETRLATKVGKVGDQTIDGALDVDGNMHVSGNLTVDGAINESDPTVPDWAKNPNPPVTVEADPVFESWKQTSEVVIGRNTTSAGLYGVSIGANSKATAARSVAVGESAKASGGDYAIAIGNAQASARGAVAIGLTASASGYQATAIGYGANASRANTIVLGNSAMTAESIYIGPLTLQSYFDAIEADKLYSKDGKKYVDANGDVWYQTNLVYYVNNFNPIPMLNLYPVGNNTWQTMHGVDYGECRVRWDGSKWHFAYANDGDLQTDWFEYSVSPSYITLNSADIYDDAPTSRSFKRMTTNGWVRLQQTAYKNDLEHYVPKTRKINGKTLDKDITIDAGGVKKVANKSPDAQGNVALTAADVGVTQYEDVKTAALGADEKINRVIGYFGGSNVWLCVTNYDSAVYAPRLQLREIRDGQERVVWDEVIRLGQSYDAATNAAYQLCMAIYNDLEERKADRQWSKYTSGLGAPAPDGTTWISTSNTVIAGGLEYKKVVTSSGAVFVMASNGLTDFGSTTNGFFRISDDEGNSLFEISKTQSMEVGADPTGITVEEIGGGLKRVTIPYGNEVTAKPTLWASDNLMGDHWKGEDEQGFIPTSIAWTETIPYVATLEVPATYPALFFKAKYVREGSTVIKHQAAAEFEVIVIGGNKYRAVPKTVSGELVLGLQPVLGGGQ